MQKPRRGREQERGIYACLVSLKNLKHLDIGYESRYPWTYMSVEPYISEVNSRTCLPYDGSIQDTLELSLDSGLSLLAELKELEMFGFESVNHRITKELDWMARNWPKLNLMYGLAEDDLQNIKYNKKAELSDTRQFIQRLAFLCMRNGQNYF
ncbi:hypothetical protein BGX27_004039 [Mortierella sp. AM989]|nr:hypothetical protein BGX27_004039 [Mortierella sp. AM989]